MELEVPVWLVNRVCSLHARPSRALERTEWRNVKSYRVDGPQAGGSWHLCPSSSSAGRPGPRWAAQAAVQLEAEGACDAEAKGPMHPVTLRSDRR